MGGQRWGVGCLGVGACLESLDHFPGGGRLGGMWGACCL